MFDRALSALIEDLTRKKFAATPRPGRSRGQKRGSRNVPAAVRRAVVARDGGRCAFVSTDGRACGERRFVEFHHLVPHAVGGEPTVENIQLRCRAHNGHEVDVFFGPGKRHQRGDPAREEPAVHGRGPTTRPGTSPSPRREPEGRHPVIHWM